MLVVGAGPAGLAAASELAYHGISCVVVEPRLEVSHTRPRAKTTSVRTMEHLRRWGVAECLRAAAPLKPSWSQRVTFCESLTGPRVVDVDDVFGLVSTRDDRFCEGGQQVAQPVLEETLRQHLAGSETVDLRMGHRVLGIREHEDCVVASVRDACGDTYQLPTRYVIACDGPSSLIRDAIGASLVGDSDPRPNFNIRFRAPALDSPLGPAVQYWVVGARHRGLIGRLDLEGNWWAIAPGVDSAYGTAHARELVRTLIGHEADVEILSTDSWTARMMVADRLQSDRVFLAGESAHLNPPWGGHGYNTCVGDAVNIGWKIAAVEQGWASRELLASYEPERRTVVEQTIRSAERNLRALPTDLQDDAASILAVKAVEFHSLGLVLGYTYAGSPVVQPGSPAPALTDTATFVPTSDPGARLPHIWMPDGSSLFDQLGPALTLVGPIRAFSGEVADLLSVADSLDIPLMLLEPPDGYPWHREFLLVRPDQHIAWRAGSPRDIDLGHVTGRGQPVPSPGGRRTR